MSLAALPCVRIEVEKTIAYAPGEVCAYRYLAECYIEAGRPETAALWYRRGMTHEPMLFDLRFSRRITEALADSLKKAGHPERAAAKLQEFLDRAEMLGAPDYWQLRELYLKLGAAYRASGDVDKAVQVWRGGIRADEFGFYYDNGTILLMAESLKVYSETFNNDSVAALGTGNDSFIPENLITSGMASVFGVFFSLLIWFIVGGLLLLPFWIRARLYKEQYDKVALVNAKHYLWADCIIFVFAPVVIGIGIAMVFQDLVRFYVPLLSGGLALMGLIGALLDALRRAHRHKVAIPRMVCTVVGILWFPIAILLASTAVFTIGTFAIFFFMGPQW